MKKKERGITLIALIVTIIVLLILASVSIAMLIGENGILTQAKRAKEETEEAEIEERIILAVTSAKILDDELSQSTLQEAIDREFGEKIANVISNGDYTFTINFISDKQDYNVVEDGVEKKINWKASMENAVAPESQNEERNNGVIGIGIDGKPVDMDLWEYNKLDSGGYEVVYFSEENLQDGKIIGNIPQYIKDAEDKEFVEVTSLQEAFMNNTKLEIAPEIPYTITNLRGTFKGCSNLKNLPAIPGNVTNLLAVFENCSLITEAPVLPEKAEDISWAFHGCTNLKSAPIIPNKVNDMHATFNQCFNLINGTDIPESVQDIQYAFLDCGKLTGNMEVRASVSGKDVDGYQDYYRSFGNAATDENANLTIKCSESVYELFNNNISLVYNDNSHINIIK